MATDEECYTLKEAQRIIDKQNCVLYGHEMVSITGADGELVRLHCDRCGKGYMVVPDE